MSANQKVLSVKDLKTYIYVNNRCNKALDGVSFDAYRGKTLCIVDILARAFLRGTQKLISRSGNTHFSIFRMSQNTSESRFGVKSRWREHEFHGNLRAVRTLA